MNESMIAKIVERGQWEEFKAELSRCIVAYIESLNGSDADEKIIEAIIHSVEIQFAM